MSPGPNFLKRRSIASNIDYLSKLCLTLNFWKKTCAFRKKIFTLKSSLFKVLIFGKILFFFGVDLGAMTMLLIQIKSGCSK